MGFDEKSSLCVYIQEERDIEVLPGHNKQIQQNINSTSNLFLKVFDTDWKKFCVSLETCYVGLPPIFYWFFFSDTEFHRLFLYFGINSLSIASFENIFSCVEVCLFISCMVIFSVQKFLILICCYVIILFSLP